MVIIIKLTQKGIGNCKYVYAKIFQISYHVSKRFDQFKDT